MRKKSLVLIILFFCELLAASAQGVYTIMGITFKKSSTERIAQVTILNLRSGVTIKSSDIGWFTIPAAIGDTLIFTKAGYSEQKSTITSSADLPVFMRPAIELEEVKINALSKKQGLNGIATAYRSKGIYYDGKPPLSAFSLFGGSPVTATYELFSKDVRNERHFINSSRNEVEHAEVARRYNLTVVKRIINASDSTVKRFIEYYTPSFHDLKGWTDYELIRHVRTSYEFYNKTADKEGLEKLNSPPLVVPEKKVPDKPHTVYKDN